MPANVKSIIEDREIESFIKELQRDPRNVFIQTRIFDSIFDKSIFNRHTNYQKYALALKQKSFYPDFGYCVNPKINQQFANKLKVGSNGRFPASISLI